MQVKSLKLLDNTQVPWMAFGTGSALYKQDCTDACKLALSVGLYHLDTAQVYENEDAVGRAIISPGVSHESLYVTTKLGAIPPGQSVEDTLCESLKNLQVEEERKKKGLTRSIGVSNLNKSYLQEVISASFEEPVIKQIEYHPLVASRLAPVLAYMCFVRHIVTYRATTYCE